MSCRCPTCQERDSVYRDKTYGADELRRLYPFLPYSFQDKSMISNTAALKLSDLKLQDKIEYQHGNGSWVPATVEYIEEKHEYQMINTSAGRIPDTGNPKTTWAIKVKVKVNGLTYGILDASLIRWPVFVPKYQVNEKVEIEVGSDWIVGVVTTAADRDGNTAMVLVTGDTCCGYYHRTEQNIRLPVDYKALLKITVEERNKAREELATATAACLQNASARDNNLQRLTDEKILNIKNGDLLDKAATAAAQARQEISRLTASADTLRRERDSYKSSADTYGTRLTEVSENVSRLTAGANALREERDVARHDRDEARKLLGSRLVNAEVEIAVLNKTVIRLATSDAKRAARAEEAARILREAADKCIYAANVTTDDPTATRLAERAYSALYRSNASRSEVYEIAAKAVEAGWTEIGDA